MLARLLMTKGWRRAQKAGNSKGGSPFRLGHDSEFYLIEKRLAELGLSRDAGETLLAWLRRIGENKNVSTAGLDGLLSLHYRLRFDPNGIASTERDALSTHVREWLSIPR